MSIGEADSDNGVQGERSSATLLTIQNSEVQVQRNKARVARLRYRMTLVMCGSHRPRRTSGRTILLQGLSEKLARAGHKALTQRYIGPDFEDRHITEKVQEVDSKRYGVKLQQSSGSG